MEKESGYIALYRRFLNWEWYDDANTMRLFIHCLLLANYKDKNWHGKTIKRGQFIISQSKLANSLKLSIMQIRTALNKLKLTGELTVYVTADYSIITVNNYDLYQSDNSLVNSQITDKQQANNRLITTTNKDNKDNKDNNISFIGEKTKKLDPYINPIKDFFISEYKKEFGNKPYLSNQDCNRLVELAADNPDIRELIPVAIKRLKNIHFDDIQYKPTANWLLKNNNFERVMNGEFEKPKTQAELFRERREQCENS